MYETFVARTCTENEMEFPLKDFSNFFRRFTYISSGMYEWFYDIVEIKICFWK